MRWLAIVFCLFSAFGSVAVAQQDEERAKACYERGQRLYDLGNYTGAIEEFKQGYLLSGLPAFLLNMGQAYKQLGDNTNALDYYKRYLVKIEPDDPTKPSVEKIIAELEANQPVNRDGPGFDSGLTQEEIKNTLGPDYNKYVSSGLTYEGYQDVQKGQRGTRIGIGVLAGGVVGGLAILIAGRASEDPAVETTAAGLGGTLMVIGGYGGYYVIMAGSKKIQEGKTKIRKQPIKSTTSPLPLSLSGKG